MKLFRLDSHKAYCRHVERVQPLLEEHMKWLNENTPEEKRKFNVPGYSYTAGTKVDFVVDYEHAGPNNTINWRERVLCPATHFNNRMRATFHLFDLEMDAYSDQKLYITEQITPIYKYFFERYPNAIGSEFIGSSLPFGKCDGNGVRNEDLCQLTFSDESFDALVSLDVLEHIPDYRKAFSECERVLKKGGRMMWSVPFTPSSAENIIRARIVDGSIVHDLPPEYHGDPLSDQGVLCFQHFGWEMLDEMRLAGFRDAYAICYFSHEFGYLGGEQFMFFAIK